MGSFLGGPRRPPGLPTDVPRLLVDFGTFPRGSAEASTGVGGNIFYWRTPAGLEVDFVWTRGKRAIGLEVKATSRWRPGDSHASNELLRAGSLQRAFAVYTGEVRLKDGQITVLPFADFVALLYDAGIV